MPDRPSTIPFPATPKNLPRLKQWLLTSFSGSAFNTCSYQPLQQMTGNPVDIKFKDEHTPYAVHTPIPVPHHWKQQVKKDIDRDVRLGIIEPVYPKVVFADGRRRVEPSTYRSSTQQHFAKCITHQAHLTSYQPSQQILVKPYSMHGTGTTAYLCLRKLKMPRHSSQNGVGIDIDEPPWVSTHRGRVHTALRRHNRSPTSCSKMYR